ncbi:Transposon TX1 putative 149 kDa [Solea senegalensis]|uniref:Transposon TX1 putative 149 kDa n=1 Tax=Solea senegalensis TaxID=28829 RepID=A0AAV6RFX7_SOLSE|nr:Transposon TX1 putative 149 kDa [Solea senegalensis]
MRCFECGNEGHKRSACPRKLTGEGSDPVAGPVLAGAASAGPALAGGGSLSGRCACRSGRPGHGWCCFGRLGRCGRGRWRGTALKQRDRTENAGRKTSWTPESKRSMSQADSDTHTAECDVSGQVSAECDVSRQVPDPTTAKNTDQTEKVSSVADNNDSQIDNNDDSEAYDDIDYDTDCVSVAGSQPDLYTLQELDTFLDETFRKAIKLVCETDVVHAWRVKHPLVRQYTWLRVADGNAKGALLRSRFTTIKDMDAPTSFFFGLEKSASGSKHMACLQLPGGRITTNPVGMKHHAVDYYSKLFNAETCCGDSVDELLQGLPQLTTEDREVLGHSIALVELTAAGGFLLGKGGRWAQQSSSSEKRH